MIAPLPTDNHITPKEVLTTSWQSWFGSAYRTMFASSQIGTTAKRPANNLFVGYGPYYDTTIAKPIWVKSTGPAVWQDAAGNVV